tara:strand:- start:4299 stop:5018 length:720 start_codon:yes stop_codon:yes gene_type:complete
LEILSIIPARGNSKGLPKKNIKSLNGHPLIAYSIKASTYERKINRTICSTDSEEIAEIAKSYGAEVPFLRPAEISTDTSTDLENFIYTLDKLKKDENYQPDLIVQLRPTSPLRKKSFIKDAIHLISSDEKIDSVRGVSYPDHTPYKMWTIDENGFLKPILYLKNNLEPFNTQRQLLPTIYAQTGTIEVIKTSTIIKKKSVTGEIIKPLFIDQKYFIDIDDETSFFLAEYMMNKIDCIRL